MSVAAAAAAATAVVVLYRRRRLASIPSGQVNRPGYRPVLGGKMAAYDLEEETSSSSSLSRFLCVYHDGW